MNTFFKNKNILVIGGTGSIGKRIVHELLLQNPRVIRIFSRDEFKQYTMEHELQSHKNLRFLIGDVRDAERLEKACNDIDIIFHLAAMKHVPACEYNPFEAVKSNVIGTQNVINAAIKNQVSRVVFTSSDKAVSPTNAMGATKLLAERLIASADYNKGSSQTVFSAVRFGNVMGSRGSVIPFFLKQILDGSTLTITAPDMTRFMMTIREAVALTMKAAQTGVGGEVFVLKMPVLRLEDLADSIIDYAVKAHGVDGDTIRKKLIGLRPGEKMYEELMTSDEASQAFDLGDMYAITTPAHKKNYESLYGIQATHPLSGYRSDEVVPLTKEEIINLLNHEHIMEGCTI